MTQKSAPGKAYREGISLIQMMRRFPNDATAEQWFLEKRWPDGVACPHCGSMNVLDGARHRSMRFRCREKDCAKRFSTKTGTVMEDSKLGHQTWLLATYLLSTSLKSVSSMKLRRDLDITQKSAWHLAHRLRRALEEDDGPKLWGPVVEVDETFVGGQRKNMSKRKRRELAALGFGRGPAGKTAVVGVKDRRTKQIRAEIAHSLDAETLHGFVEKHVDRQAMVVSDEAAVYQSLPYFHDSVQHSIGEYVKDGDIHINGIESFWSMLKRAHKGTFHKLSPKHLDRYVQEFAARQNLRENDTRDQLAAVAQGMVGKRLTYEALIAPNGLDSGTRSR